MKPLQVVDIVILVILYFQKGVQATCPVSVNSQINLDIINPKELFHLHHYTPVDERVRSPFSIVEGKNMITKLEDHHIESVCIRKRSAGDLNYNFAKLINFDNQTGMIKLEYRNDSLDLLCHTKFKMTDIFLVDYSPECFVSFYSCLMITINRRPTKFEGVYVFLFSDIVRDSKNFHYNVRPALVNITYQFLELQTNISMNSLKKINNSFSFLHSDHLSCNDIIELRDECAMKALNKGNERNIILEGIFVKIFFGVGLIFIMLIGKHVLTFLVKLSKRSNKVVPLTVGRF